MTRDPSAVHAAEHPPGSGNPGAPSPALFTDLYELTMAQAYWQAGLTAPATFGFFFRTLPPDRGYLVAAGLADVLDYLQDLRFTPDDLGHLRSLGRFEEAFLGFLGGLRFTGGVRALPEGTVFFPPEPAVEVTAPVIEAQLAETFVVNRLHLHTLLATKAARVVFAARGRAVVDFAARRAHGLDAADVLARAAYLAGFAATSNTRAGARFGIPVSGTMAHSFVECCEREVQAFRHFARSFPDGCTFLVDTYDTPQGLRNAAAVGQEMARRGLRLRAVRLDSGDLLALSRQARAVLDEAGLRGVRVVASGGLDEFEVDRLVQAGAPIDTFGVGTRVGVSADAPYGDCAYKLMAYAGRPVLKLSPGKQTLPGPKQVFRRSGHDGIFQGDVLGRADETVPGTEALLVEVMREGRRLRPGPGLGEARDHCGRQFVRLPVRHQALAAPEPYEVQISPALEELRRCVEEETRRRERQGGP